jgi:ABC-2 type transport system ATP-binding protein
MIAFTSVMKYFGDVRALQDVSFTVGEGEVFGLLGPNGAGKTTLVKIATLLTVPTEGTCQIRGYDTQREKSAIKQLIGVVPQANNLDRELTAYENLLIYGMLHKVSGLKSRIEEALRSVELWERRDSTVMTFSGGMQRRLLLARALLPNPLVLFLDEPSIGLDPQIRREMWDIIRKIRIDGRTVLITTHYIEEAEALCDRVGILTKGQLVALDSPETLKARAGAFVVDSIAADGKLQQHLCQTREEADGLARERTMSAVVRPSTLEDVFVSLTNRGME